MKTEAEQMHSLPSVRKWEVCMWKAKKTTHNNELCMQLRITHGYLFSSSCSSEKKNRNQKTALSLARTKDKNELESLVQCTVGEIF